MTSVYGKLFWDLLDIPIEYSVRINLGLTDRFLVKYIFIYFFRAHVTTKSSAKNIYKTSAVNKIGTVLKS